MFDSTAPLATAPDYFAAGWHPLALPCKRKEPPPLGRTGHYDADADADVIAAWLDGADYGPGANVGLRMPADVLGLDVDAYRGKTGAAKLAELVAEYGPLPPTWMSTARDDGASGIRFFRVPVGMAWTDPGENIELIRRRHRYAVVAPSWNPDAGAAYRWVTPAGTDAAPGELPRVADLPVLPVEWVRGLTGGQLATERPARGPDVDTAAWLDDLPEGEPCEVVTERLAAALADVAGGSRHDTARGHVLALVRFGERGHSGVADALGELESLFVAEVGADRGRGVAEREFARIVEGAAQLVSDDPSGEDDRCLCDWAPVFAEAGPDEEQPTTRPVGAATVTEREAMSTDRPDDFAADEHWFWTSHPRLREMRRYALARMVSPWAVWAATEARLSASVPPGVNLPSTVGTRATLNIINALSSRSGGGKTAAEGVSRDYMKIRGEAPTKNLATGEGIVEAYLETVGKGPAKKKIRNKTPGLLFRVPEISMFAAQGDRPGSTIGTTLRNAWSGDDLGHALGSEANSRDVPAGTYAFSCIMGVQYALSGCLFGEAGAGTPQRVSFYAARLDTMEKPSPAERLWAAEREPLEWAPATASGVLVPQSIKVCDAAVEATLDFQVAQSRGEVDELDGHANLVQLKHASLIGLFLDGRPDVTDEMWRRSAVIRAHTDRERAKALQGHHDARMTMSRELGEADGVRREHAAEAAENAKLTRVGNALERQLREAGGSMLKGALRKEALASRDRGDAKTETGPFYDSLEMLVSRGRVRVEMVPNPGKPSELIALVVLVAGAETAAA